MAKPFRLANNKTGRLFLGVLSGIGNTVGIDPTILRIAFVLSLFLWGVPAGLYLVAWVLGLILYGYDDN